MKNLRNFLNFWKKSRVTLEQSVRLKFCFRTRNQGFVLSLDPICGHLSQTNWHRNSGLKITK